MFTRKLLLVSVAIFLCTTASFAQSSGNFSATGFSGTCTIAGTDKFGGNGACIAGSNSANCEVLSAPIKTSSGSGVTLVVTPSAVTGLFTDTKITSTVSSASAEIGIQVCVQLLDSNNNVINNAVQGGDSNGCAMFDERFQQISTNLFSVITACATTECNFDLIMSTLSAHSYNFIVSTPAAGNYTLQASWSVVDASANNANSNVAACMGPGNITVTQTKVFNNSGLLTF